MLIYPKLNNSETATVTRIRSGQGLDSASTLFFATSIMTTPFKVVSLKTRVPVFKQVTQSPKRVGANRQHEERLVFDLVNLYGWTLAENGEGIYAPDPTRWAWDAK